MVDDPDTPDGIVLGCLRCDEGPFRVPSHVQQCAVCGDDVWVSNEAYERFTGPEYGGAPFEAQCSKHVIESDATVMLPHWQRDQLLKTGMTDEDIDKVIRWLQARGSPDDDMA